MLLLQPLLFLERHGVSAPATLEPPKEMFVLILPICRLRESTRIVSMGACRFPARHAPIDTIRVDSRSLQIGNIKTNISFGGSNVAGAETPWRSRNSNGCRSSIGRCDRNQQCD